MGPREVITQNGGAIHLMTDDGPACGYHRWGSETLSSTRNPEGVTCKRKGCAIPKERGTEQQ
jgi:hypothetical protein